MYKCANLVELEKCCKMNAYLPKSASVQAPLPYTLGIMRYYIFGCNIFYILIVLLSSAGIISFFFDFASLLWGSQFPVFIRVLSLRVFDTVFNQSFLRFGYFHMFSSRHDSNQSIHFIFILIFNARPDYNQIKQSILPRTSPLKFAKS